MTALGLFKPNDLKISEAISSLNKELKTLGAAEVMVANEVTDFEVATRQVGKPNLVGEHFRRSLNTLPPDQVLWAGAYDEDGSCVCTVASQYLPFEDRSLDRHLIDYFERCFDAEDGGKVEMGRGSFAFLGLTGGPFVYVGEGHVREDMRGSNFLGHLQRLLILSAYWRWRPNLIYGFMEPRMIKRKYHTTWGYSFAHPSGVIWKKRPKMEVWRDPYFVGLASEGICRLAEDALEVGSSQRRANNKTETNIHKLSERAKLSADTSAQQSVQNRKSD
ncbi:hypothetical protein [Labrenzia sp. DG1229]|uniref:hypothetical protein n=1 Tax=Labrenzia sp. DG1229 TaxID=681847 RepID=UPI0012EC2F38|nr:hypothetical protein [Labrenzia sp. DG1229]